MKNLYFNYSLGFIKLPIQFFSLFVNYGQCEMLLRAIVSRDSIKGVCLEEENNLNLYFWCFIMLIFFAIETKILTTMKKKKE